METINNKTLEKLKYELVRDGIVTYETLEKAEELANVQNINIGQALINSGVLNEDTLLKFLESKLHIPYVNLEDYNPDPKCFNYVSFADASANFIFSPGFACYLNRTYEGVLLSELYHATAFFNSIR